MTTHTMLTHESDIRAWLRDMNIYSFIIKDDLSVFARDVDLENKELTFIPVQFDTVDGYFDCSHNFLTSLKGTPRHVTSNFWCEGNRLINLVGGPAEVNGHYYCTDNHITHMQGLAQNIQTLDIRYNPIHLEDLLKYNLNVRDFKCSVRSEDTTSYGDLLFDVLKEKLESYPQQEEKFIRQDFNWFKSYYLSQKLEFALAIKPIINQPQFKI